MQETQEIQVQPLGPEDPLEKEVAIHSSILGWEISWTTGAWQAIAHGVAELDVTEHTQDALYTNLHIY